MRLGQVGDPVLPLAVQRGEPVAGADLEVAAQQLDAGQAALAAARHQRRQRLAPVVRRVQRRQVRELQCDHHDAIRGGRERHYRSTTVT